MEYRVLGESGIRVSRICLGTMTFGAQVSEPDSIRITHSALDRGVNFIDTADVYVGGKSETILGKALKGRRDRVVLASKCGGAMSDDVNGKGLSRPTVIRHVDKSLERLGTDYLDILFLHFPDYETSLDEILQTMALLVRSGKVLHYGISNFPTWQCCSMMHKAKEWRAPQPIATENVYNMITRGLDDEMLPFLREYRLGLVAFNPLAGGLLTGKHIGGRIAEGSRFDLDKGYAARYCKASNNEAVAEMVGIAEGEGVSPVQLAYQWILDKDYITSVICGVSNISQLESNIDACEGATVSAEAIQRCDEIWEKLKGDYFNYHY